MNISRKSPEVVFDAFAENYDAVQRENLGVLGNDLNVFAHYKVQLTAELLASPPKMILEFGCGIGRNLPFFRQLFPRAMLHCCDISDASLQKAKEIIPDLVCFNSSSPETLTPFFETFDLVFLAGVLHHISFHERQIWINALATTLKPGGSMVIFEHNPWNPVTRHLVSTCPFDEGVLLVRPQDILKFLHQNELETSRVRYTLLFPWRHSVFVAVENFLNRIPLGGQYCILAEKPLHV